jgi:hypothetical protein
LTGLTSRAILWVDEVDPGERRVKAPQPESKQRETPIERLVEAFEREVRERDPDGYALARLEDVDHAAAVAARIVIDTGEQWREHLGGFYETETVRRLLGSVGKPVSKQAVSKRRGLLALRTGSHRVVYPSFQFVDGHLIQGLDEVLEVLPEQLLSRWTVASWLVSDNPELNDERPITVLAEGHTAPVVAAARSWARSLAR